MSLGKWWSCRNNKKFYRKMEHDINQSLLRYILRVLLRREFRTFLNDTSFIQAISYAYLKVDILDFVTVL